MVSSLALRDRRGLTLLEMLIVVVIIGLTTLIVAPRIEQTLARRDVSGAKASFSATFYRARAAAVQNRRPATITIASGLISISITTAGGGTQYVGQSLYFPTLYGITPVASAGSLTIDPTGLVRSGTPFTMALSKGSVYDSVQVTGYGRLQ